MTKTKTAIIRRIYLFLEWIDIKCGTYKEWDYESAPYCGHYHNGHTGTLTESGYLEGSGGRGHSNFFFALGESSDGKWFIYLLPSRRRYTAFLRAFKVRLYKSFIALYYRRTDDTGQRWSCVTIFTFKTRSFVTHRAKW